MYIINSNFSLFKQIGELSDEKIAILKSEFSSQFPELIRPNDSAIMFKKGTEVIIVDKGQITYVNQGDLDDFKIEKIIELLLKANSLLSLSDTANVGIYIEATEQIELNTFEKSKTFFEADKLSEIDPYGLGIRFFVNKGNFKGDIHIEPFLSDPTKVFYKIGLQSNTLVNNIDLSEYFNEMFVNGTISAAGTARKLYTN